jgi:arabinogalactan oligomer/maltooligosaccharide transport system substrate-binding protein
MKKYLALLLALCMVFALAACGQAAAPAEEAAPAQEAAPAEEPAATGTLKIWVAEAVVDFTKEQVASFMADHPEYVGYTVSVEPVGEGDAASNMLMDVEAGADIFGFPQDQLARLVAADALIPLSDEYAAIVADENDGLNLTQTLTDVFAAYLTEDDLNIVKRFVKEDGRMNGNKYAKAFAKVQAIVY